MKLSILIAIVLFSNLTLANSIKYELYDFTDNEKGKLVSKGVKDYKVSEVVSLEKTSKKSGEVWWKKTLWLDNGYGIGVSIHRDMEIRGFGLTGELSCKIARCAFSWEWFKKGGDNIFNKLQESGQIKISTRKINEKNEISKIHFLSDISLRVQSLKKIGVVTHRILIKKGSELVLAP